MSPAMARSAAFDSEGRKRVPKACDRCRLKKVKCDGNMPCPRCRAEDAVCHFGSRRKSTERAVSGGYVEQLEIQQQILVKALKTVWQRYAPAEAQGNLGQDPSIHAIVQNLDELGAPATYRHLVTDFIFDGETDKAQAEVTVQPLVSSPSSFERTSDTSSSADLDEPSTTSFKRKRSEFMSPKMLPASSSTLHQFPTLVTTSNQSTDSPTAANLPTPDSTTSSRSNRPKFCPLPPRLNLPPVIPVPMEANEMDQYEGPLHSASGLTDSLWQLTPADWMNQCFDGTAAMGSDFDHQMEDLMAQDEMTWKPVAATL